MDRKTLEELERLQRDNDALAFLLHSREEMVKRIRRERDAAIGQLKLAKQDRDYVVA